MSDTTADDRLTADDINAYLAEHRNWGRWGHDDELGALNLITAEKRRKSAAVVRTGRTVSLSRPSRQGRDRTIRTRPATSCSDSLEIRGAGWRSTS